MKTELLEPETMKALEHPRHMKIDVEGDTGSIAVCRICLECDEHHDDDLISPCMCKGTQQFVHRSCLDHWRSVKEGFAFSHCTICKAQFHFRVNDKLEEISSWHRTIFRLFVARDIFLVFLALQTVIGFLGGLAYLADKHGLRVDDGSESRLPIPVYYSMGVFVFLALLGFFGIIRKCCLWKPRERKEVCFNWFLVCPPPCNGSSLCSSVSDCWICCGCPTLSLLGGVIVIIIAIFSFLGIGFAIFAATVVVQRIWQRHYHILTKKSLTQEYVIEDLHGCYTPATLDPKHEKRLKKLQLF